MAVGDDGPPGEVLGRAPEHQLPIQSESSTGISCRSCRAAVIAFPRRPFNGVKVACGKGPLALAFATIIMMGEGIPSTQPKVCSRTHLGSELRADLADDVQADQERHLVARYQRAVDEADTLERACRGIFRIASILGQLTFEKRLFSMFFAIESFRSSGSNRCRMSWCCSQCSDDMSWH